MACVQVRRAAPWPTSPNAHTHLCALPQVPTPSFGASGGASAVQQQESGAACERRHLQAPPPVSAEPRGAAPRPSTTPPAAPLRPPPPAASWDSLVSSAAPTPAPSCGPAAVSASGWLAAPWAGGSWPPVAALQQPGGARPACCAPAARQSCGRAWGRLLRRCARGPPNPLFCKQLLSHAPCAWCPQGTPGAGF